MNMKTRAPQTQHMGHTKALRRQGPVCARNVRARFEAHERLPLDVEQATLKSGLVDYYHLLQVPPTAKTCEIKTAYRQLQKLCHPDILGPEAGNDMSILLNQAYTVLADENTRELYNVDLEESRIEEKFGFTNKSISEWVPATRPKDAKNWKGDETRALFVDERTCIGCKNCVWQAPNTFVMEEDNGRARAVRQWADTEDNMQNAVDSCPVDCIHWVEKEELPVLEHVMKNMGRIPTGIMRSYAANAIDVFAAAETFKVKKLAGREARRGWTEAYMYTKAQEDAMDRARASPLSNAAASLPGFAAFRRMMGWIRSGFVQEQPQMRQPRSYGATSHRDGPAGSLRGAEHDENVARAETERSSGQR